LEKQVIGTHVSSEPVKQELVTADPNGTNLNNEPNTSTETLKPESTPKNDYTLKLLEDLRKFISAAALAVSSIILAVLLYLAIKLGQLLCVILSTSSPKPKTSLGHSEHLAMNVIRTSQPVRETV